MCRVRKLRSRGPYDSQGARLDLNNFELGFTLHVAFFQM